jgi:hypothetical protein
MRSENFENQSQTFTRYTPTQIERAAMTNGLTSENPRNAEYASLLKRYTHLDGQRVDRTHYLMQQEHLDSEQSSELEDSLDELRPRHNRNWRNLNYQHLKDEGVIRSLQGALDGKVRRLVNSNEWDVWELDKPLTDERPGYGNHFGHRDEIRLDSKAAVQGFALSRGIQLPENYDGGMSAELKIVLGQNNYNFGEGVRGALDQYRNSRDNQSLFSFRNYSTGNEVQIYPIDMVEQVELFSYFKKYDGFTARFELGGRGKSYPKQTLIVPKRRPSEYFSFNQVTLDFLAEFYNKPFDDRAWWLNMAAECTCTYSKQRANSLFGSGETKRTPHIIDAHVGSAIATILDMEHANPWEYLLTPSDKIMDLADKLRYNVIEVSDGNRKVITEDEMNIALMSMMKLNPEDAFAAEVGDVIEFAMKPINPKLELIQRAA